MNRRNGCEKVSARRRLCSARAASREPNRTGWNRARNQQVGCEPLILRASSQSGGHFKRATHWSAAARMMSELCPLIVSALTVRTGALTGGCGGGGRTNSGARFGGALKVFGNSKPLANTLVPVFSLSPAAASVCSPYLRSLASSQAPAAAASALAACVCARQTAPRCKFIDLSGCRRRSQDKWLASQSVGRSLGLPDSGNEPAARSHTLMVPPSRLLLARFARLTCPPSLAGRPAG